MRFQEERARDCYEEAGDLFRAHWELLARHKDHPLRPDFKRWLELEEFGRLACYTARVGWALKGYAVYIVERHTDYPTMTVARQRVLYIDPAELAGVQVIRFARFIRFCDDKLKERGVTLVVQHVKYTHDFSALLKKLGYEDSEKSLEKRL